jgi:L-ascorbate metabolism protein UlaG (beta-lactamase superfamily)
MPKRNLLRLILISAVLQGAAAVEGAGPDDAVLLFPPPARNHVTFWGHSCCYIDVRGFGIVTDPVFAGRYMLRRRRIPVPPDGSRSAAGLILVSHGHLDHLDPESISLFPDSALVLCPWTVAGYISEIGRKNVVMSPGDTYEYPHGEILAVPAMHPGKRFALRMGSVGDAIGFVITTPFGNIYYSGDTEYFNGMIRIGATYNLDIAILNINPHLSGTDAVRAVWATRARIVIPVHFGAYDYILFGPLKKPRGYREIEKLISEQAVLLQPGESIPIGVGASGSEVQNPAPRR